MNNRRFLFVVGVLVLIATVSYLYISNRNFVSTENAYIKADKVILAAEVSGRVIEKLVVENQQVSKGDILLKIDRESYDVSYKKALAKVSRAEASIRVLQASYKTRQEELILAEDNLEFAENELERQINLAKQQFSSASLTDTRQHELDIARHQVAVIKQDLDRILASLNGKADLSIQEYPEVQEALADLAQARISLEHTELTAPFNGFVSNVPPLGKHLVTGSPAMSVIASEEVWVEANFNETELENLKLNQPVEISVDAYPAKTWHGNIVSFSPATGAEFSILPPQNATGNWIKVVQRVPVRINIIRNAHDPVLRAGMSVDVTVNTGSSPI